MQSFEFDQKVAIYTNEYVQEEDISNQMITNDDEREQRYH